MSYFLKIVKKNLTQLPYPIGSLFANIPYSFRPSLGHIYKNRIAEIRLCEDLSLNETKSFIFIRTKVISEHACKNIPFYQELYKQVGVDPSKFTQFDDLKNLPIINKEDFQKVDLEYRSFYQKGRYLVNTGGSTGKALELYIEPSSIGHEWAHMHTIWNKLNFKQNKLKIVFSGRADVRNILEYDSARHQISVDIYSGWKNIADELYRVFEKYNPAYLHGYPSAIADFSIWLLDHNHPLLSVLRKNIKGVFLGSEYPPPPLRLKMEKILNCASISWYGHTERAILAYEKEENNVYSPFISYGFAEAVENNSSYSLISTSYYNFVSPLIRYDTGDYVSPKFNGSLLDSFKIKEGRNSDFILDKIGNKIFLTALIFGRHHEIFNYIKHIQVYQPKIGYVVILLVASC